MCFCSDKDDAGRQLDPTKVAAATAIQTPGDATELSQEGVATLDSTTDATHARLSATATLGRLHPKASRVGAGVSGAVAVGTIGTGTRQIPWVRAISRRFSGRRLHDHRFQDCSGLHTVVGPRLGHHGSQRQAVFLGR
jgi:hypothetical protein